MSSSPASISGSTAVITPGHRRAQSEPSISFATPTEQGSESLPTTNFTTQDSACFDPSDAGSTRTTEGTFRSEDTRLAAATLAFAASKSRHSDFAEQTAEISAAERAWTDTGSPGPKDSLANMSRCADSFGSVAERQSIAMTTGKHFGVEDFQLP
ncbi:hypothetical protein I317_02670 [Kwoniella heveanensis CBS 569]|nr:hypothetical protein I317_02670 [Kwoniella heveanensis CBS 569]